MRTPLLSALAAGLLLLGGCKESLSDKAFNERVRSYLLSHPEVLREMAQALDEKEAQEAVKQASAALKDSRRALEHDSRDFVANPDGKLTVVQFFDYNCAYCKLAAPEVLALIKAHPDVRFVFKELPIIGGEASQRASRIALAVKEKGGDYLGLYHDFIAARPLDNAGIERITAARGLDAKALEAVAEQTGVDKHIADDKALAQKIGLQGTPTFIIGDEIIEGADVARLKAAIEKAKA